MCCDANAHVQAGSARMSAGDPSVMYRDIKRFKCEHHVQIVCMHACLSELWILFDENVYVVM